ncbi:MAG TPA: hypothetical protein VFV93_06135 [Thermomicrobiales bacterium]|nr:hypothetical protein [Thermomicrobiales bacterium]
MTFAYRELWTLIITFGPVAGFIAVGPEVGAGVLAVAEQFLAGAGGDDERTADSQLRTWLDGVAAGQRDAVQATVAALDWTGLRWVGFRRHGAPASCCGVNSRHD